MAVALSVVIPVHNEEANVLPMVRRLRRALAPLRVPCEFLFVDDGSTDGTVARLLEIRRREPRVRVLRLSRRFGHQAALTAGLAHANGRVVVLMDGDLQDPPEVVPRLAEPVLAGECDVAYAVRRSRRESLPVRALYAGFYRLLRWLADIEIPTDAGDFCALSHRAVEALNALPERTRFLRGLRAWVGFRQLAVPYDRAARAGGRSKYSPGRLVRLAVDGVTSFSYAPLRLGTIAGLVTALAGLAYAAFIVAGRLAGSYAQIPGWSTVVAAVLVLGGVQLIMLGVIGEYLGRLFEEVKGRPAYIVAERIGFDDADHPQ